MTLRLNGSSSGYAELDAPAVAGNNTLRLPSGNGTSGQVLQTDGSGNLSWTTLATTTITTTSSASASGTTSTITTGIPSATKRVTLALSGISTGTAAAILIQLGTSGGTQTSGYSSSSNEFSGNGVGADTATNGFVIRNSAATYAFTGLVTFALIGSTTWVASGVLSAGGATIYTVTTAGQVTLSGALTQMRATTVGGTASFDAGTFTVLYEG
jgi:hypothetical protein